MIAIINFYQTLSKRWLRRCVFTPSCSMYAKQAFEEHKPHRAFYLMISRLLRCRPGVSDHYDPVPYPGDSK